MLNYSYEVMSFYQSILTIMLILVVYYFNFFVIKHLAISVAMRFEVLKYMSIKEKYN